MHLLLLAMLGYLDKLVESWGTGAITTHLCQRTVVSTEKRELCRYHDLGSMILTSRACVAAGA